MVNIDIKKDIRTQISDEARKWIELVEEGELEPVTLYIKLWAMKQAIDKILKKISWHTIDKIENDRGDTVYMGVKTRVMYGRPKLSYERNEEWQALDKQIAELKSKKKEIEQREKHNLFNPDKETGEVKSDAEYVGHTSTYVKLEL